MAGTTQESFEFLFPLWSLKKNRGGVYWFRTKGNVKSSKIEVDIIRDIGILIMLLLVMVTKMMIILLLVLLLLTTNESNNYNNCNNYNNVITIEIIINEKRLKVAAYIIRLIPYSVKKMLLNSMFVSLKVICCY